MRAARAGAAAGTPALLIGRAAPTPAGEAPSRLPAGFQAYAPRHRERCLALFDANCPAYFAPNERDDYAAFLTAAPRGYFVQTDAHQVTAAFGLIDEGVSTRCRLNWIMVQPALQQSGVGRAMIAHAIEAARAQGASAMDVSASHISAPYFARFGAHTIAVVPNGWGPGMHRVEMELSLR